MDEFPFEDEIGTGLYGLDTDIFFKEFCDVLIDAFPLSGVIGVAKLFVEFNVLLALIEFMPDAITDDFVVFVFDSKPLFQLELVVDNVAPKLADVELELIVVFWLVAVAVAVAGFDRVLNLNLLPTVAFFGDARNCCIFSSNFFMAVTYDAFELSCLSMSNVSIAFLPFFSGVPYFAYKSSIQIASFGVFVGLVKTKSVVSYSAKISSSKSSCFAKILFAVLKPCSSSLIKTQSDELLAVLRFATLFTVLLIVFTVRFSIVSLFG